MRGKLTENIATTAKQLLGVELTQEELRLMPYVQYTMMNNQRIDPNRINENERKILTSWREREWIEGGAGGLSVSKNFWDAMNELMWLGYVAHEAP